MNSTQYLRKQELRIQQIQEQQRFRQASLSRQANTLLCAERVRSDAVRRRMGRYNILPAPPSLSESPRFSVGFTRLNERHNSSSSDGSWTPANSEGIQTLSELMFFYLEPSLEFSPEPSPEPRPLSPPKPRASRLPVLLKRRCQVEPDQAWGSRGRPHSLGLSSCTVPKQPSAHAPGTVPKPPTGPRPQTQKAHPRRALKPRDKQENKCITECASEMPLQATAVVCKPPTGPAPKTKKIHPAQFLRSAEKQEKAKEHKQQERESDCRPLNNPAKSLMLAFDWLKSEDWLKKLDGLKVIQSLARYHQNKMLPKLHDICLVLIEEIKNLRSTVACFAIKVMADMYIYLKSKMNPEVERTCRSLLLRLANGSNAFIHEQVNQALHALVENCNYKQVVTALLNTGMSHCCIAVRASTSEHLKQVLDKEGAETIFSSEKVFTERFLVAVSKMAVDAAPGVRCFGHQILKDIALHRDFLEFWKRIVPKRDQHSLDKIIKRILL